MRKIKIRRIALWMKTLGFKVISFTFLILCFLLISKSSFGQELTVTCTITKNVTCSTDTDGEISVSISGGDGNYQYSINSSAYTTTPSTFTITGLGAGEKIISVQQTPYTDIDGTCTITLAPKITLSTSGQNWSCWNTTSSSDNCNGNLTIGISGGQSPYSISITGPNGYTNNPTNINTGSYTFENLCSGDYNFTVSDGCTPTATTTESVSYTIYLDNAAPTGCVFPDDYYGILDISSSPEDLILTPYFVQYTSDGGTTDDKIFNVNANYYTSIQIEMQITQYNENWTIPEYIEIQKKYKGSPTWHTVHTDNCNLEEGLSVDGSCIANISGTTHTKVIPLGNDAMNIESIRIRCVSLTAGNNYNIGQFRITGNKINGLEPNTTGNISECIDPSASEITYIDGPITFYCNDDVTDNFEFSFNRRWKDGCGYIADGYQKITVGQKPYIPSLPDNATVPFCNNLGFLITPPTLLDPPDNCTSLINIKREWRIYDKDDKPLNEMDWTNYNGPTTYNLPAATNSSQTFTVGWRITDQAGFSTIIGPEGEFPYKTGQTLTLNPYITITLSKHSTYSDLDGTPPYDICSGNTAGFLISAEGGNDDYTITVTSPPGTLDWNTTDDDTGLFVTSGLITTTPSSTSIKVQYQDTDGCPTTPAEITFNSGGGVYVVHPNITTGTITRTP